MSVFPVEPRHFLFTHSFSLVVGKGNHFLSEEWMKTKSINHSGRIAVTIRGEETSWKE